MAGNASGERELLEQPLHALFVLCDVRIDLRVGAFHVGIGDDAGTAMARTDNVDHAEVPCLDRSIQMGIDEIQARGGAPVTQQPRLYMFLTQRLLQQRVIVQINLSYREIVRRPPVGIDQFQFFLRYRISHDLSFPSVIVDSVDL